MARDENALSGFIIAVLAAEGVDDAQIRKLVDWLHEQGAIIHPVSVNEAPFTSTKGGVVRPKVAARHASGRYYDAVFIPGGARSAAILAQSGEVLSFLQRVWFEGRNIAALAEGTELLLKSEVARGHRLAVPKSLVPELDKAGAFRASGEVALSGQLLSARSASGFDELLRCFALESRRNRLHDNLDDALRATFPASDAPSSGLSGSS